MNILVIEDDPVVFEVVSLSFCIDWPEVDVVNAPSGELGLEMIRAEEPDVVLLDIGLPGMDGFEVCSRIRAFSDVPVILLTVRSSDKDRARGLALGANDYIVKPFKPKDLVARVSKYLTKPQ